VGDTTAFSPPEAGRTIAAPGTAVGDFLVLDAGGAEVSFARWRDRSPAVVFFWSVFCQPCREEFERLVRFARRPPAPGLKVLAVNIDAPKLRPQAVRLLAKQGEGITGVFDRELAGGHREVADLFGVSATPSTFLIGPDGTVRAAWSGEVDEQTLTEAVASRLTAGPVPGAEAR
jgi:peroxiredoxin